MVCSSADFSSAVRLSPVSMRRPDGRIPREAKTSRANPGGRPTDVRLSSIDIIDQSTARVSGRRMWRRCSIRRRSAVQLPTLMLLPRYVPAVRSIACPGGMLTTFSTKK